MEPKRELASVDLRALVGELGSYEGAFVDKAYLYGDDLLRLRLRDPDRGRLELLVEVGERKRLHVADPDRVPDAPERPPNFAKMLRNRISGATFAGAEQHGFDRIVRLAFERDDADTTIVAELFGDGNVAVLDESGSVVDSLETVRLRSRTVAPGAQYEYPEARVDPLSLDRDALAAHLEASDTDVVRTLATQLDLGGDYAEELCTRAGVEKELAIADADEATYDALYDALSELADALRDADLDPRVYYEADEGGPDGESADEADGDGGEANGDDDEGGDRQTPIDVTPIALAEHEGRAFEQHDTFNAAVDAYFYELERAESDEGHEEPQRPDFQDEIETQERIVAQQEEAIEGFEREAAAVRRAAETLYANYEFVDDILRTVRGALEEHDWETVEERLAEGAERGIPAAQAVEDVDPQDGRIRVRLDRASGGDGGDGADEESDPSDSSDPVDGSDPGDGSKADDGSETNDASETDDATDDPVVAWLDPSEGVEHNADRLYQEAKGVEEKKEGAKAAIADTRERLAELEERRDAWEADQASDEEDESGDEGDAEADEGRSDDDWLELPSIPVRSKEHWYDRFRWVRTSQGFLVLGGRDADQNEELVKKYLEPGDRFLHAQAHGGPVTILKAADPSESGSDVEIPEAAEREAARFAVSSSSVWKEHKFAGDVYAVDHDQVSKTPESGEYLEKGGFAIRGDRTYYDDVEVGAAVGIQCEPETLVIGGPPESIADRSVTTIEVEPGKYAQGDVAKRIYREFRERFADTSFVRKVASPDLIQHFLPPGTSRIVEE